MNRSLQHTSQQTQPESLIGNTYYTGYFYNNFGSSDVDNVINQPHPATHHARNPLYKLYPFPQPASCRNTQHAARFINASSFSTTRLMPQRRRAARFKNASSFSTTRIMPQHATRCPLYKRIILFSNPHHAATRRRAARFINASSFSTPRLMPQRRRAVRFINASSILTLRITTSHTHTSHCQSHGLAP